MVGVHAPGRTGGTPSVRTARSKLCPIIRWFTSPMPMPMPPGRARHFRPKPNGSSFAGRRSRPAPAIRHCMIWSAIRSRHAMSPRRGPGIRGQLEALLDAQPKPGSVNLRRMRAAAANRQPNNSQEALAMRRRRITAAAACFPSPARAWVPGRRAAVGDRPIPRADAPPAHLSVDASVWKRPAARGAARRLARPNSLP